MLVPEWIHIHDQFDQYAGPLCGCAMDQIAESMNPLKQRQSYRATQARIRIQQESVLRAAPYQAIWG